MEATSELPQVSIPYGATKRPRLVARIAEAGSVAGRGCSTSPQDMPDALHFLVLTVAGWVNRPPENQIAYLREEPIGPPGLEARPGPSRVRGWPRRPAPSPRVPRSLAGSYPVGPDASCGAQTGGVRRPLPRSAAASPGCGGAGRVGPPATRHRLCLLRQMGDQLIPGHEQFLLVDDVVAVEDSAALVAGKEHGDPLGNAGADQVAGGDAGNRGGSGRHAGRLTGGAPRRAPAADGGAVAVEDVREMRQKQVASGTCDRHVNPADGVGSLTNRPRTHPAHAEGRLDYEGAEPGRPKWKSKVKPPRPSGSPPPNVSGG